METFTKKIIAVILDIPAGYVATYGQIARLAGNPRGARQVARVLHSMSEKHQLPWHRVVNAKGEIVIRDSETAYRQKTLLENEGVKLVNEKSVDLIHYRWDPKDLYSEWIN